MAATLLVATAAVVGTGAPAFAEPHADQKYCQKWEGGWTSGEVWTSPVGYPYSSLGDPPYTHNEGFYDSYYELKSGAFHAVTFGRAYLKKDDYFSIDATWNRPRITGEHAQFTTAQLAGLLGSNFRWHYCQVIYKDDPITGRDSTPYDRAPADGWYRTEMILGAHRGVRLCVTRPSLSPNAHCVGDTGTAGWYVDNDDDDPSGYPIADYPTPESGGGDGGDTNSGGSLPPGGPDEPDPPSGSTPAPSPIVVFQANTGFLYTRDANGTMHDTRYGMMRGTSPATSNGQVAFQANTGFLYTRSVNGSMHDTQYGMMNGTSPAISGGQIAFQANTSLLYTRNMNTGQTTDLRLGMMAGTSPSIAGNTSSWRIAFQANDGFLYYRDSGGATVNTGLGMMRGSSPSITKLSNGTYVIAFQANTGLLYVHSNNWGTDLSLGLMTDTSPAITSSGNAWTIAFQANTGFLFTRTSAGATTDTRYGMMAHTSPSARGNRIVFQANTGFLYYRDGTSAAVNTAYGMLGGTSPGA